MIAFVDPPSAIVAVTAFSNASVVRMSRGLQILPDHLDDPPAGGRRPCANAPSRRAGIDDAPGQRHAERLGGRRHRRGRAHRHAGAERAGDAVFHLAPRALVERARAAFGPVLPDVAALIRASARASCRAASVRRGRRCRQVRARRAHEQRRHGLVAAAEQHGAVSRDRSAAPLPPPSPAGCDRASCVGFMNVSPSVISGISIGNPPACQTPRLTSSARSRKCAWHGFASLQVFRMAMMGLPAMSSALKPACFARERWPNERRSSRPNQRKLRRSLGSFRRSVIRRTRAMHARPGRSSLDFSRIERRDVGRDRTCRVRCRPARWRGAARVPVPTRRAGLRAA